MKGTNEMPESAAGFRAIYEQLSEINRTLGNLEAAGEDRLRGQQEIAKSVGEVFDEINALKAELAERRRGIYDKIGQIRSDLAKPLAELERIGGVMMGFETRLVATERAIAARAAERAFTKRQLLAAKGFGAMLGGGAVMGTTELVVGYVRRKLGW